MTNVVQMYKTDTLDPALDLPRNLTRLIEHGNQIVVV